jgi:putative colanic acid biosynthesis UDP-glucose lipid carrier transferase
MEVDAETRSDFRYESKRKNLDFLLFRNDLIFTADIAVGIAAGYIGQLLYFMAFHDGAMPPVLEGSLWREIVLGSVIAALVLREPRLAQRPHFKAPDGLVGDLCQRGATALAILLSVGLATRALDDMARLWVLGWSGFYAIWVVSSRWLLLSHGGELIRRGELREAVAVLGSPGLAEVLATRLSQEAEVVAVLDELDDCDEFDAEMALEEVQELANAGLIDTIVLAVAAEDLEEVAPLLEQLKAVPVQVTVCSDPVSLPPHVLSSRILGGVPLAVVADRPLQRWDLISKAVIDRAGAALLLIILAPFLLGVALAIALESPGPVIFRQLRCGWGGRSFTIYKFRTMRLPEDDAVFRQATRHDPRCTRVGAFLRRTSLDELPQLLNVLLGTMSLVGPRPHAEAGDEEFRAACQIVSEYAQRQRVKPGITGWAQIHGLRGAVRSAEQMRRRVQFDLYYIDHWSVWLDLEILACTPWSVLRAENAY